MSNITDYLNYLNSVRDLVTYYPTLITLPLGLIGNIISILTFSRPNLNKKTNSGFLYIWLCAFNLCLILYFTFVFESTILFDYSVSFPCGVSNYLFRSIWCFVPWMQVIICVDRFIVVFFPIKKALMSKKVTKILNKSIELIKYMLKFILFKWLLCIIIICTLVLIFTANIANLLTYQKSVTIGGVVSTRCYISTDVSIAASLTAMVVRIYIPFSLMLTLNLFVFRRLRRSKSKVNILQTNGAIKNSNHISAKEHHFIVSTLFIDLVFFLFYTPTAVYISIWSANIYTLSAWTPLSSAILNIFLNCSQTLVYLYSVLLIFAFVVFNRTFRIEVVEMLRLKLIFPSLSHQNYDTHSLVNNQLNN